MAEAFQGFNGGMKGLSALLKKHGAAINSDLMRFGWRRADLGRRLSWRDMLDFVEGLKPDGDSTYVRSIRPRSWWVTPEYVAIRQLSYAVELGNWQRAGGRKAGSPPKAPVFPTDSAMTQLSPEEVADKRAHQREHLAARRKRKAVGGG